MMATATMNKLRVEADQCLENTQQQEAAAVALKKDALLRELESSVKSLVKDCLECYADFRMQKAEWDASWAKNPALYNQEIDEQFRAIYKKWVNIFGRLANLLGRLTTDGIVIQASSQVQAHYGVMLSVERMDNAPLPDKFEDVVDRAIKDHEAGATTPWTP